MLLGEISSIPGLQINSKQKRTSIMHQSIFRSFFFLTNSSIGWVLASTPTGSSSEVLLCFQESLVRFLVFKVSVNKRETLLSINQFSVRFLCEIPMTEIAH